MEPRSLEEEGRLKVDELKREKEAWEKDYFNRFAPEQTAEIQTQEVAAEQENDQAQQTENEAKAARRQAFLERMAERDREAEIDHGRGYS